MSEELVVLNNNTAVAAYSEPEDADGNWEDMDDIQPQYISIKQALTTGMDAIPVGHFYHRATGKSWAELDIVVLKMNKTRDFKPSAPKFVEGEKSLCRSVNGKSPVTGDDRLEVQAKTSRNKKGQAGIWCENCPKNSWAGYDKKTGEGPKPLCNAGFHILFIDKETRLPYIFNASGQSVAPAEAMQQAMFQMVMEKEAELGRKKSSFEYLVTITTEQGYKAKKLKITRIAPLTEESAAEFGDLYRQFVVNQRKPLPTEEPAQGLTQTYEVEDTGQILDSEPAVAI